MWNWFTRKRPERKEPVYCEHCGRKLVVKAFPQKYDRYTGDPLPVATYTECPNDCW